MITYPAPVVADLVGVTYHQLDYWDRTGVCSPTVAAAGSGTHRGYTKRDVTLLRLMAFLSRQEVSTDTLRCLAAADLRQYIDEEGRWTEEAIIIHSGRRLAYVGDLGTSECRQALNALAVTCTVVRLWGIPDK